MRYTPRFSVGLTGGIASGKSTAASVFSECGACVVDADAHSRALTASGGGAIAAIKAQFGAQMIDASGALNRNAMRTLAFSNPQAKQQLTQILHPLIFQACATQAAATKAPYYVFDIPLLLEAGGDWQTRFDALVIIDVPLSLQISRIKTRNQWDDATIEAVLAQQVSQAKRKAAAQATPEKVFLINNEGELSALAAKIKALHAFFLEKAR